MEQRRELTDAMSAFIGCVSRQLPDDVKDRLEQLRNEEGTGLSRVIYDTMFRDLERAAVLGRPLCQDTGVLQFFVDCGADFPALGALEGSLRQATADATRSVPLRHNCVETFDEQNTGTNTGLEVPTIFWNIVPGDHCRIWVYMAGGGCTLPGRAAVLMPSEGYEGIVRFVMDTVSGYGVNACPPLLVGVGIATSAETAALLSKRALMRPLGSRNPNEKAAALEARLEDGLNRLRIGPQGLGGQATVLGVHIENAGRHPSTIGVGVNVGCWAHRRGCIVFDRQMKPTVLSHRGVCL